MSSPTGTAALSTPGPRIVELDVLRGFALCGILPVNVIQQLVWIRGVGPREFPRPIALLFDERFLTIFGVLFGVGFGLFLARARSRTDRPRVVLGRRLGVLLAIGVIHFFFHQGEVLSSYGLFGLLVLIPLSFLGGRAALAVAVVLLAVLPQIQTSYGLIPGLLALGYAFAALGVPEGLHRHPGRLVAGLVVFGSVATAWWVVAVAGVGVGRVNVIGGGIGGSGDLVAPTVALATGLAYCCALLVLLRTGVGRALGTVLAPMGRMALTNYLSATVLLLVVGGVFLRIDSYDDTVAMVSLIVGILVVQAVWSRLWLARFRYGPVEWAWRCLTWWQWAPLRRPVPAS